MITGIQYFNDNVLYMMKKHYCPFCNTRLKKVKVSCIVNSDSPEAKDFDFTDLCGNVKFVWKEFECEQCKKHFTVKEMKKFEKMR